MRVSLTSIASKAFFYNTPGTTTSPSSTGSVSVALPREAEKEQDIIEVLHVEESVDP